MSLIASFPGGLGSVGWRRLAVTAAAFCLAPSLTGALVLGLARLLGPETLGEDYLQTLGLATAAMVSPLVLVPIWAGIGLGAALLLRVERFGWLPALLLGAAAFAALIRTEIGAIGLPFGAVSGLLYRMALALQRPEAF